MQLKRERSHGLDDEAKASKKRLRDSVEREEVTSDKRVNGLDNQIVLLTKEQAENATKRKDARLIEVDKTLAPGQSLLLQFITEMRSSLLPRELRDMIFDLLWDDASIDNFPDLEHLTYSKCPGRPCGCLKNVSIPHFLDPDFMGPETAVEVAEALFRKLPWTCGLVRPDDIKHILYADAFHIGFAPVNVARILTVRFSLDRCARKEFQKFQEWCDCRRPGTSSFSTFAHSWLESTLKDNFEALLGIRHKGGFKLEIVLVQKHIRLNILEKVLDIIKPVLFSFTEERADVSIMYQHDNDVDDYTRDPQPTFVWDLSVNFALDAEDWKAQMIRAIDAKSGIHDSLRGYRNERDVDIKGVKLRSRYYRACIGDTDSETDDDAVTTDYDSIASDDSDSEGDDDDDDGDGDDACNCCL